MFIVHDQRVPERIASQLKLFGQTLPFITQDIVPEPLAGHPDIFCCQVGDNVIIAPDIYDQYIQIFNSFNIRIIKGKSSLKNSLNRPVFYNAVVTNDWIIHHKDYTDPQIQEQGADRDFIHVNQAFTRCSLLPLKNNCFITSDKGVENILNNKGLHCQYINPEEIILPGYRHGLLGGCMGISDDKIFIMGNLRYLSEGDKLRDFLENMGYTIIELYDGPLFDGGSIFIF